MQERWKPRGCIARAWAGPAEHGYVGTTKGDIKVDIQVRGLQVALRDLRYEDVTERYLSWFRDGTVTQFLSARNLQREDVLSYIEEGIVSGSYHMLALCEAENGLHIGNVKIGPIDRANSTSDVVTIIGDRRFWGKGLATEAIALATKLAFTRFGIRKVCGSIIGNNVGSVKSYTRGGWHIECVRPRQYMIDGSLQDEIFVGCFNPDYPDPS
jgi:RimJ/RimL family protein N-acetyltransferase